MRRTAQFLYKTHDYMNSGFYLNDCIFKYLHYITRYTLNKEICLCVNNGCYMQWNIPNISELFCTWKWNNIFVISQESLVLLGFVAKFSTWFVPVNILVQSTSMKFNILKRSLAVTACSTSFNIKKIMRSAHIDWGPR